MSDELTDDFLEDTKVCFIGAWDIIGRRAPMLFAEIARLKARLAALTAPLGEQPQDEAAWKDWATRRILSLSGKAELVPMILYCPKGHQHIDEGEWKTKPHKTHQCQELVTCQCKQYHQTLSTCPNPVRCLLEWKPASFATVGVEVLP